MHGNPPGSLILPFSPLDNADTANPKLRTRAARDYFGQRWSNGVEDVLVVESVHLF